MKIVWVSTAIAALACAVPAHAGPILTATFDNGLNAFAVGDSPIKTLSTRAYQDCCRVTGSEGALDNTIVAFGVGNVGNRGALSTQIETIAGVVYTLTFRAGAYGGGWTNLSYAVGDIGGTIDLQAVNDADATWHSYSFDFVGSGMPTTLSFFSQGSGMDVDAVLDDVAVTAPVPEPATWALMMLGFGGMAHVLRRRRSLTATRIRFA